MDEEKKSFPEGFNELGTAQLSFQSAAGLLTPKQERFCEEYAKHLNIRAAYLAAGYSEHSAHVNAYKIFGKPHVQKRIKEMLDDRRAANKATVDWVMRKLQAIAEDAFDVSEFQASTGALKLIGLELGMFQPKSSGGDADVAPKDEKALDAEIGRLVKLVQKKEA